MAYGQLAPLAVAVVDQDGRGRDERAEFQGLLVDGPGGGVGAEDAPAELDRRRAVALVVQIGVDLSGQVVELGDDPLDLRAHSDLDGAVEAIPDAHERSPVLLGPSSVPAPSA